MERASEGSAPSGGPADGKLTRRILVGVLAGAAVYAAVAIYADLQALIGALSKYAWWTFAAAIGLTCANYALRFIKWQLYLRKLKILVPTGRSLLIFLAGFVMSITPGKLGEVLKSFLLRQSDGVPAASTAPVVLAERLTDLLALIVLAATGVGTYQYGARALVITSVVLIGGVVVASLPGVVNPLLGLLERLPLLQRAVPKLREAYLSTRLLLSPGLLLGTTLLSVFSWGLEAVAFVLILHGFAGADVTLNVDMASGTFVYAITTILGAVSFLPGGLGVTEAGMITALENFGMVDNEAVASAATILTRLATLWWAVVCGVVAFALFQRQMARKAQAAQ